MPSRHSQGQPFVSVLRVVSLVLLAGLCGCAARSVPWQNPSLPKDQWHSDWTACKRWAEDQVGFSDDADDSPFRDYDRAQARRRIDAYAGQCMRDRGYFPVRSSR